MFPIKLFAFLGIVALTSVGVTYAATALLSHNTPPIPVPGQAFLSSPCVNLSIEGTVQPVAGTVVLDCGPGTVAFHVFNPPNTLFVPTFTVPTADIAGDPITVTLGVSIATDMCSVQTFLTSGQGTVLPTGDYDYCENYSGLPSTGGSIPGFTISWT